ncbi:MULTISPECIES: membrane or secreted protein [unclassified Spirosoma]|uniref:membrane or secreted protein n=1 Tax=unclassified Spirosoma TaxID=2621999 RepID=UPI0009612149|nr:MULTISPECIES: membrane or secreted protein [unclassified Spirosoma]MBN8825368.1 membrane or secreted protein [Spirosoma sp.]OJW77464.1 MAG: membrane or secreted protein [Spirosoma sp. 48-14]
MHLQKQQLIVFLGLISSLIVAFRPLQKNKLEGAWRLTEPSGTIVMLTMADNYLIQTTYEPNRFISTRGGAFRQEGNQLNLMVEFDTKDSSRVGQTETYPITISKGQLTMTSPGSNRVFTQLSELSTPLTGLWRITGRANDAGQMTMMQRGPRKTIKLLTGSRFQWVAINPQTKQFSGTGGGTYVLKSGIYTETIDFFSRDNGRVGRSLTFKAAIDQDEWHHTGQSSTGGAVNEIWTREK